MEFNSAEDHIFTPSPSYASKLFILSICCDRRVDFSKRLGRTTSIGKVIDYRRALYFEEGFVVCHFRGGVVGSFNESPVYKGISGPGGPVCIHCPAECIVLLYIIWLIHTEIIPFDRFLYNNMTRVYYATNPKYAIIFFTLPMMDVPAEQATIQRGMLHYFHYNFLESRDDLGFD
jgi:hypothetical protein